MRNNGEVSGRVIELRDDQIIISRTDLQGRIVYANPDFIEISGFSETELLGHPHNIVRHPDMPRAVFADLWADLKAGRPWVGVVKNRCKNGDAYWVEAHISPILEKGVITGYMSMRRRPTPEQIADAEKNYAILQAGGKLVTPSFEHGRLSDQGWWHRLRNRISNARLATKFIVCSLLIVGIALGGSASFLATYVSQVLNDNARKQLRHDVKLLRAAVTARIESANISVNEHAKILTERLYTTLGGRAKASRAGLLALGTANGAQREKTIRGLLKDLQGAATIFVLTPEGFQRCLSTATDEHGDSAVGTYLDKESPAHALLLAGKPYAGPARIFGHQYTSSYTPLFDASGAVIGASVIGIDLDVQLATLKSEIRTMKVGESGYYYIADVTPGPYFGTMVLHPYQEGHILADALDKSGRNLLATMAELREGELEYPWKNVQAGETTERLKLVIFESLHNPPWVIAGGSAIDEFTALSQKVVLIVVAGGLAMAAAIFVIILVLLRTLVLKPLNTQVLPTFQAMAVGNFDTPLDVRGKDEMAQVIQGLESLRNRLAFETQRERTLARLHDVARREAEGLSRARADFLANMSHEIRTPLNAVIGLAYLLRQSRLEPRDQEYIKRIEGAGKLLLAIVNDILDFSKIDAGKLRLEEAPFRLDDVLDNLSSLVRTRVQQKGLTLEYVVDPAVPQALRGDALRLSQILINLVSNAIKFTTAGSITLFVDSGTPQKGRSELTFRVRDTGIGMSADQMANLFRAFSQADSSVTRKFGGTGLGLVISKRLIEMMGGSIWVDSQPQSGSTFSFKVWLGTESASPARLALAGYRVLVVDDNDLARKVLERLLINQGCSVTTVDSGEAALAEMQKASPLPFACVMVDLNMPDMDGLVLGQHIRAVGSPTTKLVMVTGENVHASRYRHALGDFDSIVEKPVTAARINEVLRQLQDSQECPPASPEPSAAPLAGLHILVAEDVPTNQLIMRDLLESLGATVNMADNGKVAVRELSTSSDRIDLILMDIQMPEMDGLEATRQIRRGQVRADIPIIALTAHALEEERQRTVEAGMNDFLTKPIEPERLIALIQRWRPHPEVAATPAPETTAAPAAAMPDLPGIDTVDGLQRMLNRQALYEKVLRDFHARFNGETGRIRAAIAAQDIETASRLAHSLKGTGGMIGATRLAAQAAALEQAIKNNTPDRADCLEQFDQALSQVLDGIQAAFPNQPST